MDYLVSTVVDLNTPVDLYPKDGKTEAQIAEIVGLNIGRVPEIITTFTSEHGGKSATKADKRRKLTEKDRIAISRHLLGGEGQKEVAKAFHISLSKIYRPLPNSAKMFRLRDLFFLSLEL